MPKAKLATFGVLFVAFLYLDSEVMEPWQWQVGLETSNLPRH